MKKIITAITLLAITALQPIASAHAEMDGAIKIHPKFKFLTDEKGMTLYIYDKDEKGTSNCYDDCAKNWPPLMAAEGAEAKDAYSLITRKDGKKQWAYKEMPLYLWLYDEDPGDTNGDGMGGVWHTIKPE